MLFGKRPPRKTPDQLVLATQAEPFINRDIQQAVIAGPSTVRLVREFSNESNSHSRAARAPEQEVHKITPMTVICCFVATSLILTIATRWITKDPWNPPEAVLALQKIGDFKLSPREAPDGKLTDLETRTRASCANKTKVQFSTPRTRIGDDGPSEAPVVILSGFGGDDAGSKAYTLCLIKQNVDRLCDGDSVKHTAETLQGYFWSLDAMNGFDQSLAFDLMRYAQAMQPDSQFNKLQKEIGIDKMDVSFPKSKADPEIVSQVRNLMEQGYLRKSDLFFDLRGAPQGAKGLFDDVVEGKAAPCEKSA
ncbi:MAG: hypothetical protein ACK5QO_12490 [Hyphomonadaceae bacterium]